METWAVIVKSNGDIEIKPWPAEKEQYALMSDAVGGYIERVHLRDEFDTPIDMWVNEEGLLRGLPVNVFASGVASDQFRTAYPIVGDVLFTSGVSSEGETNGMNEDQLALFMSVYQEYTALS